MSSYRPEPLERDLLEKTFDYDYPVGLDLHPLSETHSKILQMVLDRAHEARQALSGRFDQWQTMDELMTSFIPKTEEERLEKQTDDRRPVAVVVPLSYAIEDSIITHLMQLFLRDVYFMYDGVGPEDEYGALLLQHHVQQQCLKAKIELSLATHWQDALRYGIGILTPGWETQVGPVVKRNVEGYENAMGEFVQTGQSTRVEKDIIWEGSTFNNISPYNYFPDPNTPAYKIQKSEFVGWISRENRMDLVSREHNGDEELFNCKFLPAFKGGSALYHNWDGRKSKYQDLDKSQDNVSPVDVIWMYVNLIPSEHDLGDSDIPEKWLFGVANDSLIIQAKPLALNHNLYPVAACTSELDGYSVVPVGRLDLVYGLQEIVNFIYNSRVTALRKSINGMFIYNPDLIYESDLVRPSISKMIRMRRFNMDKDPADAIHQLNFEDPTQQNMTDIGFLTQTMERVSGAPQNLQGLLDDKAPERRTAAEFMETRSSAMARLSKLARLIAVTSMRDLGYMTAAHTIQLASQESWVKVSGEIPRSLQAEFQTGDRILVHPSDMQVNYDIVPFDASLGDMNNVQQFMHLFEIVAQHPVLTQVFDISKMFISLARRLGENNVLDYLLAPGVQTQVLSDEQVGNMAADGEIRPTGEV